MWYILVSRLPFWRGRDSSRSRTLDLLSYLARLRAQNAQPSYVRPHTQARYSSAEKFASLLANSSSRTLIFYLLKIYRKRHSVSVW